MRRRGKIMDIEKAFAYFLIMAGATLVAMGSLAVAQFIHMLIT